MIDLAECEGLAEKTKDSEARRVIGILVDEIRNYKLTEDLAVRVFRVATFGPDTWSWVSGREGIEITDYTHSASLIGIKRRHVEGEPRQG